ncbi:hypothetical protein I4U23_022076 [Adineta vaga]|nr:hypothetical protein I4U23_022076 [Adineta vaga]
MSKKVPSKSLALDPSYLANSNPNKKSYSSSKNIATDNINNIQMVSSKPKSKCTVSRFLCIQLLILLLLLTLAAIIIPIVVIILDTTGKQYATTYSQSFVYNTVPTTQCSAWQTFTSSLTCTQYKLMRIYGSNDPTGITLTDTYMVTALAK